MIDLVFIAMIVIVPILWGSVWLAHKRSNYEQHKKTQLALAAILLVTVVAFEVEVRFSGWRHLAKPSPFWQDGAVNDWIDYSLIIHLLFAIPTPILWGFIIFRASKGFPSPAEPSNHSAAHRFWGKLGAFGMTATAVTGWVFYYLAFVAV